jgi:hypothetical protein
MNELEPICNRTGRGKRTVLNAALVVSYQRHCFDRSIARRGPIQSQADGRVQKVHGSVFREGQWHRQMTNIQEIRQV